MKTHFNKLRPLALLLALFMLTNCQDDADVILPHNTAGKTVGKRRIIRGDEAGNKREGLVKLLHQSGGNTLTKLSHLILENDITKSSMKDIEDYIDDSEVFEITQEDGLVNQTYRVRLPDASTDKFYNLVVQTRQDYNKIMLLTYEMDKKYVQYYAEKGNLSKFTGTIAFEAIFISPHHPCDTQPDPNPVPIYNGGGNGGGSSGGGSSGGGSSGGGSSGGGTPSTGSPTPPRDPIQPIVKFEQLEVVTIEVEITAGEIIPIYPAAGSGGTGTVTLPGATPGFRNALHIGSQGIESGDPCEDYEEIGILDPEKQFENNCDELIKFSSNAKNYKSLKDLEKTADSKIEDGFSYSDGKDPIALVNKGDLVVVPSGGYIYGASHDHPNPKTTEYIPMFSMSDIYMLGLIAIRNKDQPKNFNKFIFTLTVQTDPSTIETFAIKIDDWNSFLIFLNTYNNKTPQQLKSDARRLAKQYSDSTDKSTRGYARVLLKYMDDHNIKGIGVYKSQDEDYQSWNKLSLDSKNILTEKPCL